MNTKSYRIDPYLCVTTLPNVFNAPYSYPYTYPHGSLILSIPYRLQSYQSVSSHYTHTQQSYPNTHAYPNYQHTQSHSSKKPPVNKKSRRNQESTTDHTTSLNEGKTPPMAPLSSYPNIPHIYCEIDRGKSKYGKYLITKLPKSVLHETDHTYLSYTNGATAQKEARKWSNGRDPVHHYAHETRQKDHYHITKHYHTIFDSNPDTFVNIHFQYGPPINRNVFESRRNKKLF